MIWTIGNIIVFLLIAGRALWDHQVYVFMISLNCIMAWGLVLKYEYDQKKKSNR